MSATLVKSLRHLFFSLLCFLLLLLCSSPLLLARLCVNVRAASSPRSTRIFTKTHKTKGRTNQFNKYNIHTYVYIYVCVCIRQTFYSSRLAADQRNTGSSTTSATGSRAASLLIPLLLLARLNTCSGVTNKIEMLASRLLFSTYSRIKSFCLPLGRIEQVPTAQAPYLYSTSQ